MQAIISDRGRQYPVKDGDTLVVDLIVDAKPVSEHVFDQVLVLGDTFGTPFVKGASVKARIEKHFKGPKMYVEKFRRRKDYRRRVGHRQSFTKVTIASIAG